MGSNATILVVDDDPQVGRSLTRLLQRDGHAVLVAESAARALELLAQQGADLAILDYKLPDIDGLELAARMKVLHPHTVRVLLTAHSDFSVALEAINRAGVYRYLLKPFDDTKLRIDIALAVHEAQRLRAASRGSNGSNGSSGSHGSNGSSGSSGR